MIRLTGVNKSFDGVQVLSDVALDVADGESTVLIGPSACGKTLLLKCIIGLVRPDSGSIRIAGVETIGLGADERAAQCPKIGMLFQRSALFDSLTVWENIAFRLMQDGAVDRDRAREIAIAKLAAVGMGEDVAALQPVELSGGMQKRVGLARAIADDPQILLLDEPTAGLDPIMTNVINELILENARELGATVVSVTSNLDGARHIADRIAMMHQGRIMWCGPTSDIDDTGNEYVDQFINSRGDGPIETITY